MQLFPSTTILATLIGLLHALSIAPSDTEKIGISDTLVSTDHGDILLVGARNTILDTSNENYNRMVKVTGTESKAKSFDVSTLASSISDHERNTIYSNQKKIDVKRNSDSVLNEIAKALLGQESSIPDTNSGSKSSNPSSQGGNNIAASNSAGPSMAMNSTFVGEKGNSGAIPTAATTSSASQTEIMNANAEIQPQKKSCPCSCLCDSGSIPRSGKIANSSACAPNSAGSTTRMVKGAGVTLSDGSCACSCLCPSGSFSEASGKINSNITDSSPNSPSTTLSEPVIISQPTPATNSSEQVLSGQEPAGKASATALSEPVIISQPTPVNNPLGQIPGAQALSSAIPSPLMSPSPQMISESGPVGSEGNGINPIDINSYSLTSSLNLGPLPSSSIA